ncbi:MAG: DMT family transporter [Flavobacteriaceae bacterium]|nr:DMT family transporter [Flavobacteriaceae bacterium]
MPNAKLLNYLHLHLIVFIWGFTAVLGALITIDAVPLVWYRMGIASILIGLWLGFRKVPFRVSRTMLLKFFLMGGVIAMHWLAFFGAIKAGNVSVTLAIMATGAFFTAFLEPIFYRRKVIGYEVLFGLIVMIGLYIIFKVETEYVESILLALLAAFLGALFAVVNGKFVEKHAASVISFYELLFGTLCITVYLWLTDRFTDELFQLVSLDWFYLFILASICTAYAFIASVYVMKWISPYTVMLTINLEPVYGILLALLILGETENMSVEFYYGAAIILITVIANGIIKNRIKRNKKALSDTN